MIQTLYNPYQKPTQKEQNGPWLDDYDTILISEIFYHNIDVMILTVNEWENIIKSRDYTDHRKNDLIISLLTSNLLVSNQLLDLCFVFSNIDDDDLDEQEYKQFKNFRNQESKSEERISQDVRRTYQLNPFFKNEANIKVLQEILTAYSNFDQEIGYSQGMNFIAGSLIYMFSNQTKNEILQYPLNEIQKFNIFRILKHIMITKEWRQLFLHGTPGLFACLAKFQYKFKSKLPLLFKHLINLGIIDLASCFTHHFMTILFQEAPIQFAPILLNLYLIQGEKFISRFLISILKYFEQHILTFDELQHTAIFLKKKMVGEFFKELQKSRNQQRMLEMLININLVKKNIDLTVPKRSTINRIITKPYRVGVDILGKINNIFKPA